MEEENGKEKRRPLTFSEKVRNILIGLGAASGLILGLVSNCKGEPVAEKTWVTLRTQVNDISGVVNKLTRRVVFLQAHEAGRTAAEVQLKLEALQKETAVLRAALAAKGASPTPSPAPAAPPKAGTEQKCSDGHILANGRCQRVPLAVAKKVKEDEAALRQKLEEEKRRRKELEQKEQLMKKLQQQPEPPRPPPTLRALPKKLEDVKHKTAIIDDL